MTEQRQLTKLHGLGNDFLVQLTNEPCPDAHATLARRVCDRHRGVGADGLLCARPGTHPNAWTMTLHNADGSLAEMSGNGIRCFAQAVIRHAHVTLPATLQVSTGGGARVVTVSADPDGNPDVVHASVQMGQPAPGPEISGEAAMRLRPFGSHMTWDLGNPHLVINVEDPSMIDPGEEGPRLEACFEDGINVHFVAASSSEMLQMVTWERGAGVTQACGTGATAAALSAFAWGAVGPEVAVQMPGGTVRVAELASVPVLTGPSEWIAEVSVRL